MAPEGEYLRPYPGGIIMALVGEYLWPLTALRLIPKIITFLGSVPFPQAVSSLRGKILQYRWTQGLTIKKLAGILGIDPTTLARWERGEVEPRGKLKERVNSFLKILTGQAKLVVNQS